MRSHPVYGEQLHVEQMELLAPEDEVAMERYLASGVIKGIKAALAARIVRRFKGDTFRVIEEEPERLAEIKGIRADAGETGIASSDDVPYTVWDFHIAGSENF